jgi:XTP/dITP diphosphohydrolase
MTLADDSGLEVDLLGGHPGVRSARFAREGATDSENNAALVQALATASDRARTTSPLTARFRCVLAFVSSPDSGPLVVDGTCEGSIVLMPRGTGGFGYDPHFMVDGAGGRTLAELSDAEKNAVSHRGRAMAKLKPLLATIVANHRQSLRRETR